MAEGRKGPNQGRGRPKGAISRRAIEVIENAALGGMLPLEYMLKVMRDDKANIERRDDMAKAAAPYLHPKFNSVSIPEGDEGTLRMGATQRMVVVITNDPDAE